jgi:hypothetical protein
MWAHARRSYGLRDRPDPPDEKRPKGITMTALTTRPEQHDAPAHAEIRLDTVRLSTKFGLAFTVFQLAVMVMMAVFVLPNGGSPSDPALERGRNVLEAADLYRAGNYMFMVASVLLLGFLGAVHARLKAVDRSGALATVGVAAGTLLAVLWPFAGVLHDVARETAAAGTDPRILGGWDAVAPFSLAFSVLPRVFFVGALILGLRATGAALWLQRTGVVILVLSVIGSGTLLAGSLFPILALSTLGYEVWIGALALVWLREHRAAA